MAFFKSEPPLPDGERARIEFHFQQVAECLGHHRLRLPVLDPDQLPAESVQQIKQRVADHLQHDLSDVRLQTIPLQPEKIGGGG